MNRFPLHACLLALVLGIPACATRMPPDIGRDWQPVNRYAPVAHEIPLQRPYVFQPSPMDGTLKTLLARWASDSGMALAYLHPSDFTLFEPVQRIRTPSLRQATADLSRLYAGHRVVVEVHDNRIVVAQSAESLAAMTSDPAQGAPP